MAQHGERHDWGMWDWERGLSARETLEIKTAEVMKAS